MENWVWLEKSWSKENSGNRAFSFQWILPHSFPCLLGTSKHYISTLLYLRMILFGALWKTQQNTVLSPQYRDWSFRICTCWGFFSFCLSDKEFTGHGWPDTDHIFCPKETLILLTFHIRAKEQRYKRASSPQNWQSFLNITRQCGRSSVTNPFLPVI